METRIVNSSSATYRLQSAEIKTSQDGKTSYVVANFAKAGLDELMAEQESGIRLQILPAFGADKEHATAYLQKWVDKVGEYTCQIGAYEVGGFEKFLRKDSQNKWLTTTIDGVAKKTVFESVVIYWFCDEDGNPVRGEGYIRKRAENLFNNSTRIMTVAKYKEQKAKAEAAKKAAEAAKDDLVTEAEAGDDDEI